jgi:hypothetical protein
VSSEPCYRHPSRLAVEHCEICRRPVCGLCLWYAESGQRLCPDHAADFLHQGRTVTPPERYADGIAPSEVSAARAPARQLPYQGNSTDVTGLIAALTGLMALLSCAGLTWAFPLMAFALGLVAWIQARDSANPARTRWLAGLGLASGGVFILMLLVLAAGMAACLLSAILASSAQPAGGFPTPLPFATAAP